MRWVRIPFHRRGLSCLLAFELKIGEFKPEYVGNINLYFEALDREVKKDNENTSVGVILFASTDDEDVEFASNTAEYLPYVASVGDQQESIEMRYEDENIWLTQKRKM